MKPKIYLARPISGCTVDEVQAYYSTMKATLQDLFVVFNPMIQKEYARTDTAFKSFGASGHPESSNKAITRRDRSMVVGCDIVYLNLLGSGKVSIGSVMELAWAYDHGKHVVVAMEDGNIHDHAFIRECSDAVFCSSDHALEYLRDLAVSMGSSR